MKRALMVVMGLSACTPGSNAPGPVPRTVAATSTSPVPEEALPSAAAKTSPRSLGREAPLEEGIVSWEGLVRPTKGGHDVRGVTLDSDVIPRALGASAGDGLPNDSEWFLGAIVRVTADLRKEITEHAEGGLAVQTREGTWYRAARIDSVELVARPQVIEGKLARSKGFFTLAGHLLSRGDLAWSLSPTGGKEGDWVRVWGQPRTVVCEPNAQCLTTGSLPLFDVGRASLKP